MQAWEAAGVDAVSLQGIGDTGQELVEEFRREAIAKYGAAGGRAALAGVAEAGGNAVDAAQDRA